MVQLSGLSPKIYFLKSIYFEATTILFEQVIFLEVLLETKS